MPTQTNDEGFSDGDSNDRAPSGLARETRVEAEVEKSAGWRAVVVVAVWLLCVALAVFLALRVF